MQGTLRHSFHSSVPTTWTDRQLKDHYIIKTQFKAGSKAWLSESASNMQAALNFCWKVSRKLPIWTNTLTTHISVKVSEKKPLVLWNCWLGVRKSIRPVKIEWWGVNVVVYLERGADCLHTVQLMPLPSQTPSSLASFKSRLLLPFWYRLIHADLERRPLNRCCSSNSSKWRK